MADDISRRIDDLLSGAIDEQVREQRVLNDMMIGVRDGVSRLVGDVAALSARVTESRETSQGLREELPFLVQREVSSAVNSMSVRVDVLETAIGELVASLAGLEDRVGPDVIIDGVSGRLQEMRAAEEEQAGAETARAAEEAIRAATESLSGAFEQAAASMAETVEKHHAQISRRLADVKKWADDVEHRMKSLEKSLEANVKMPGEVRKQLNELTGATQDMTDSVLEEIRINAESAATRISASVEGLDHEAIEMNRRFAEMNDAMRSFQEQMLAYLQVRDVALEERRDQIVTELLAEFFNELPERDRERTVGRLRSVFARRRDRRDADRYRSGAKPTPLPSVSPEAVARAEADLAREQRRAERPWAEPAPEPPRAAPGRVDGARRRAPEPAPASFDDGLDDGMGDELAAGSVDDDFRQEAPAPAAKKAAAKKAAAKKPPKTAAKKTAAKKTAAKKKAAPEAAAPDAERIPQADVEVGDHESLTEAPAAIGEITRAASDTGEIDLVEMQAFAAVEDEEDTEAPPSAAAKKKAPAKKKTAAKKKAAPAEPAPDEPADEAAGPEPAESADEAQASEPASGEAAETGDTLQQALARVQALVDQHRKPPGGRKR